MDFQPNPKMASKTNMALIQCQKFVFWPCLLPLLSCSLKELEHFVFMMCLLNLAMDTLLHKAGLPCTILVLCLWCKCKFVYALLLLQDFYGKCT